MHEQPGHHEHRPDPGTPMGTDPVCGMNVLLASPHRYAANGAEVVPRTRASHAGLRLSRMAILRPRGRSPRSLWTNAATAAKMGSIGTCSSLRCGGSELLLNCGP